MKPLRLITVSLLVVMLAACAVPTAGNAPALLDNTSWLVTAIKGKPTLATHQPSIAFQAGKVSGTTGCNRFTGGYAQSDTGVSITALAMTQMACSPEAVVTQESAFAAATAQVTKMVVTPSGLELQDSAGQALLALIAASTQPSTQPSPLPLAGTTWTLRTIRVGQTVSSAITGTSVTLTINPKTYAGKACNTFGGDLTVDGPKVKFDAPHSTKMACKGELMQQESRVLDLLIGIESWTITGSQLSLSSADGSGLDFIAQ